MCLLFFFSAIAIINQNLLLFILLKVAQGNGANQNSVFVRTDLGGDLQVVVVVVGRRRKAGTLTLATHSVNDLLSPFVCFSRCGSLKKSNSCGLLEQYTTVFAPGTSHPWGFQGEFRGKNAASIPLTSQWPSRGYVALHSLSKLLGSSTHNYQ